MSETTTIPRSTGEDLQSGLDELRLAVVDLRRRKGELAGDQDRLRRRRDELHALLDDRRATARIEGTEADTAEITTELAAIAVDLGIPAQTVPPSQSNPGGSVVTQGRPGALPLALRRLDSEIVQAEAAAASYISDHREAFVQLAHGVAAQADEARSTLVRAAEAVEAAEAATAQAYGIAFSGASDYNPDEREAPMWGRFRPERPYGVPADLVDAPGELVRRLGGRDRVDPRQLLQLVKTWAARSARPSGFVDAGSPSAIPAVYEDVALGMEISVGVADLRNPDIRAAVTPDEYQVARLHFVEPLD